MSDAMIWIGLVGMMAMTLLTRSGIVVWPGPIRLPLRLQRALRFAPMAAIAAVIVPSVVWTPEATFVSLSDPRLISALACILGWWHSRQMSVCLSVGIVVYAVAMLMR
ncbi:MAG: AzlD domain-containing protein [Burkholderiaceae bacterium]|nr:AzlD domain-containing protein [Burkholderiaceae bacterium]